MKRVNVVTEGQSEMFFVKNVLNPYFNGRLILDARPVLTSRDNKTNYEYRGGLRDYAKPKKDICNWLLADKNAYVSTMFDFFRLPDDFPGYAEALKLPTHLAQVEFLERKLKEDILNADELRDIRPNRFLPYIQLHEFESLLYTDISVLKYDFLDPNDAERIDCLCADTRNIPPEDINNGPETAPSKRLLKAVAYQKGDAPSEWLETIGVKAIKAKCPHFSAWLDFLRLLAQSP